MIVVDTNVIAYLLILGHQTKFSQNLLRKDAEWVAPILWKSEFRNVLTKYLRIEELTLSRATRMMTDAEQLMRKAEFDVNSEEVLKLAEESNCSAYDCEFVALARELQTSLVTTDKSILRAFPKVAVSLQEFV